MIVLIHGRKRSGKDTFASILKELKPELEIYSFAQPLKEITAKSFGITLKVLDDLKNDESIKIGFRSPNAKMCTGNSVRNFLQNLGTEAMKPIFGDDVWADLAIKHYNTLPEGSIMAVPDFRVPEEYEAIKALGLPILTVKINRDCVEVSGDTHITENGLAEDFEFDFIVDNNGTLDDLRTEAVELLDKL